MFCTGVANFHYISVEYLAQFVRFWEMVLQQVQETFCDVGNDVLAIWRVKPDDVSTSVMFRFVFPCLCIV